MTRNRKKVTPKIAIPTIFPEKILLNLMKTLKIRLFWPKISRKSSFWTAISSTKRRKMRKKSGFNSRKIGWIFSWT